MNDGVQLADVTRWHSHVHASATPMMLIDNERRRVEVNVAACNLLGRPREELLGMGGDELVPAETRLAVEAAWGRLSRIGWLIGDVVLYDGDGRPVEVEYVAIANVLAGIHLVVFHSSRQGTSSPQAASDGLTEPERQVLTLTALGTDAREIAQRLNVSLEVVLGHLDRATARLKARNLSHLVAIAVRRGLIDCS